MILYLYIYIYRQYIYICVLTYHIYILHKWYKSVYIIFISVHIDMHLYTYIYILIVIYIYIYINMYIRNILNTMSAIWDKLWSCLKKSLHWSAVGLATPCAAKSWRIETLRSPLLSWGGMWLEFSIWRFCCYIYICIYILYITLNFMYIYIYILHTLYTNKCYIYIYALYIFIILHNLTDAQPTVLLGAQPTCSHLAV